MPAVRGKRVSVEASSVTGRSVLWVGTAGQGYRLETMVGPVARLMCVCCGVIVISKHAMSMDSIGAEAEKVKRNIGKYAKFFPCVQIAR